ncbi:CsbD family protein [Thioalkalivibrio sp.]|uniref:CsbD family protein n=1 Tax=Thioalkalivibrio sp. TaxID=2093813 RepID=UPI00356267AD
MNKDQAKGHGKEAKGKVEELAGKATGDKSTEYKGKAEKHAGKAQAKYGDIKSDAKKKTK